MRTLSAHQRFAKSRSRWILPAFPEHTFSVLRGLGQSLNKQKTLIATEAEMSVFLIWRAICIACEFYTKFGITDITDSFWIAILTVELPYLSRIGGSTATMCSPTRYRRGIFSHSRQGNQHQAHPWGTLPAGGDRLLDGCNPDQVECSQKNVCIQSWNPNTAISAKMVTIQS